MWRRRTVIIGSPPNLQLIKGKYFINTLKMFLKNSNLNAQDNEKLKRKLILFGNSRKLIYKVI